MRAYNVTGRLRFRFYCTTCKTNFWLFSTTTDKAPLCEEYKSSDMGALCLKLSLLVLIVITGPLYEGKHI